MNRIVVVVFAVLLGGQFLFAQDPDDVKPQAAATSDETAGKAPGRDLMIWSESSLKALDYQTGNLRWEHPLGRWEDWAGVLSTAGDVEFTADNQGNMLALDARTGDTLWHAYGGAAQNGPITYELDGRQYVIYGA